MASPETRTRPRVQTHPEQPANVWIIRAFDDDASGAAEALLSVLKPPQPDSDGTESDGDQAAA